FASVGARRSAALPVAGTVHNTNTLLGRNGFVGVKTGSDDAAGGCFAFRAIRWIDGKRTTITGVVLGQPGHGQIAAALAAADAMVDRIAGYRAVPDLQQLTLPLGMAPRSPRSRLHARQTEAANEKDPSGCDGSYLIPGRVSVGSGYGPHVCGLRALGPIGEVELNLLILVEVPVPGALDRAEVHKDVGAILLGDETETLL